MLQGTGGGLVGPQRLLRLLLPELLLLLLLLLLLAPEHHRRPPRLRVGRRDVAALRRGDLDGPELLHQVPDGAPLPLLVKVLLRLQLQSRP